MKLAPIAMFVYNRLEHTRNAIEKLSKNHLADKSDLFIFSDGPKNEIDADQITRVREYIKNIKGFYSVTIVAQDRNIGLANSVMSGVNYLCEKFGRVIVVEDDLETSTGFLSFMNDALSKFEDDDRVLSISGYMYPLPIKLTSDAIFLEAPHSWGWATWKNRWKLYSTDGKRLMNELQSKRMLREFNYNGPHNYQRMLTKQISGLNDSWYIRWYAVSILSGKMSVYPIRSLVRNFGLDGTGVHCRSWKIDPYASKIHQDAPAEIRTVRHLSTLELKLLRRFFRKVRIIRIVNYGFRSLERLRNILTMKT